MKKAIVFLVIVGLISVCAMNQQKKDNVVHVKDGYISDTQSNGASVDTPVNSNYYYKDVNSAPYSYAAALISDLYNNCMSSSDTIDVQYIKYVPSDGETYYDTIEARITYLSDSGSYKTDNCYSTFENGEYDGFFFKETDGATNYASVLEGIPSTSWSDLDTAYVLDSVGCGYEASDDGFSMIHFAKIENKEIYNDNDLKITILDYNSQTNEMTLQYENTSNKDWDVTIKSYAVNGIMMDTGLGAARTNVPADSIAKNTFTPKTDYLSTYGLDTPVYFDFLFWAYDNSVNFKDFDTGQITVETDQFDQRYNFVTEPDAQSDGFDFHYLSSNGGIYCAIENTNDYYCSANIQDLKLNKIALQDGDYNFYDNYDFYILAGCSATQSIDLSDDFELGEDLESMSFSFEYRKKDDFSSEKREKISIDCKEGD